jgi:lipoate-protein ligase A
MVTAWRVIDTGIRRAAENFAFNRAILEARREGAIPSTLRFLQFRPSALLGFHQSAEQELNLDYCREHTIDIQRRITGGGAIYMDPGQFGWELYLTKADVGTANMEAIARRICEAAARAVSTFGLEARYRPRNDIEVNGRKISGTGGAFDGDALLYQGTLLVEFDVEKMVRCLRISGEKLSDKAIADARERVVNLKELLGYAPLLAEVKQRMAETFAGEFGIAFEPGQITQREREIFDDALAEIDTPEWVYQVQGPKSDKPVLEAATKFAGGLLRAAVAYDRAGERIRQVRFTGDIFVNPPRTVADLEAALKDCAFDDLELAVRKFFSVRKVDMLALAPEAFIAIVQQAVRRAESTGRRQ